jgi:hypothetical protein
MMALGSGFAVICLGSITDNTEKEACYRIIDKQYHKQIIDISFNQMNHFAGNMLEVKNTDSDTLIVMSQSAYDVA